MVIDSSVLVALLFGEPEAERFATALECDLTRLLSAASALEASIVIESQLGESGERELDLLLFTAAIEVVPFTREQLRLARRAYRTFGKGRHPAALNFGDCFSYALSKASGEPLLFKGKDFSMTDVTPCDASTGGASGPGA